MRNFVKKKEDLKQNCVMNDPYRYWLRVGSRKSDWIRFKGSGTGKEINGQGGRDSIISTIVRTRVVAKEENRNEGRIVKVVDIVGEEKGGEREKGGENS